MRTRARPKVKNVTGVETTLFTVKISNVQAKPRGNWHFFSGYVLHSAMIAHRALCCVSLRCSYKNEARSRAVFMGRTNAPGKNLI
eukprot:3210156-Pleurochrysis_carterae.AAC.2